MSESEMTPDQAFIEFMVKGIVEHPEDVHTERTVDDMGTLVSLHVNSADMGTIIGKEGRTAKALRTLLRVMGAKNNDRVNLKIIEPEGGRMSMQQMEGGDMTPRMMPNSDSGEGEAPRRPHADETYTPPSQDMDNDVRLADGLKDIPMDELA